MIIFILALYLYNTIIVWRIRLVQNSLNIVWKVVIDTYFKIKLFRKFLILLHISYLSENALS